MEIKINCAWEPQEIYQLTQLRITHLFFETFSQGKQLEGKHLENKPRVHMLDREEDDSDEEIYPMFSVNHCPWKSPYMVDVELNRLKVRMEMDTGASLSVNGENIFS